VPKITNKNNIQSILKKLKPPSRKNINPEFKNNQKDKNLRKSYTNFSKDVRKKNKSYLSPKNEEEKKRCNNNKRHYNKKEFKKIFKLSDFGLCTKIENQLPSQFGGGIFLAPEICKMGPDCETVSGPF
jgi:hypothetical protein